MRTQRVENKQLIPVKQREKMWEDLRLIMGRKKQRLNLQKLAVKTGELKGNYLLPFSDNIGNRLFPLLLFQITKGSGWNVSREAQRDLK